MRKTLLTLLAAFALAINGFAQTWNMVITRADGTKDTLKTSEVKDVSFFLPDQNVEQVIIKEIYNGGCPSDQGDRFFQQDKGFILYNNCPETAVINNLAVGIIDPNNAEAVHLSKWHEGKTMLYEKQGFIPALHGIWWFQSALVIPPYSQVVVCCEGAIDNTQTYSKSANYANKDYYAMYDPESGYDGGGMGWYPSPAEVIPTSHYLKAKKLGKGFGWPLSVRSPGLFVFRTKGVTPAAFANNIDNVVYPPGASHEPVSACFRIPVDWVIDGVEVYTKSYLHACKKRFTPDIDGGYVVLTYNLGHTLYRNVDKAATEALPENAGKLVYGYTMGVSKGDPSNIDAEASIKRGAHIVYMDTNNSTNDFHERKEFSIRGK